MKIGSRSFNCNKHTFICGILNVTPDSFSDGNRYMDVDEALRHAEKMIEEGADIIDIGGESTRPGYTGISDEEEISRVIPVIEAIRSHFEIPLSLDTYKSKVARAGIDAGINMINDIWGMKADPDMPGLVAETGVPVCLMHNREDSGYGRFEDDVISDLKGCIDNALKAGIYRENIILDPGVGFAKSYEQNLETIACLERIGELGFPVLLGVSRKSVVGLTLGVDTDQRLEGTLACGAWGVLHGVSFLRVHDVKEHVRMVRMLDAVRKYDEHTAYLSIGSNIGDRMSYIEKAIGLLAMDKRIKVEKVSTIMETEPYGGVEQENFYNGAIKIKTTYTPSELLKAVGNIEKECGRIRTIHWGPRTLDLDIVLYDELYINSDGLTIPHKDMHNRRFVLDPMCEIAPYAFHPVFGCSIAELQHRLEK
ncbi:MAG: dihydropteroate synthase [Lachnospiraceae bacterium]|nr:dihydropteroate synthase [Lachnospiraceae bacterium]